MSRRPLLLLHASALFLCAMAAQVVAAGDGTRGAPAPLLNREKLYDAVFVGEKEAWVAGYPGVLLHTVDGGASFTRVPAGTDDAIYALTFPGPGRGFAVGRGGLILATADGGRTWSRRETGTEEHLFSVAFADPRRGVAVGSFGTVARTTDGGATWTVTTLEPMANAAINAVAVTGGRFIAVGEFPSWDAQLDESVSMETISNMFASDDGGASWRQIRAGVTNTLHAIAFEGDRGWASGSKGTLIHTTDGGATWSPVPLPAKAHLFRVTPRGGGVWVTGADGVVIDAGGAAPRVIDLGPLPWVTGLAFGSGAHGLLVGGRGTMHVTRDGGVTWRAAGAGVTR